MRFPRGGPAHDQQGTYPAGERPAPSQLLLVLLLVAITTAVYAPLGSHEFVTYDDSLYVTENPVVQRGLSLEGLSWAFTTGRTGNWHPLTWLSHMLDCQLFGLDPGPPHLHNLLLHIINTLLLFAALARMTGSSYRSGVVAVLFALHPLHVESVAWVAERKDLLSTLLLLLALHAYLSYAARPGAGRYLPVFAIFALGLMAKPMIVTFPFLLLLLDFWPLSRLRGPAMNAKPLRPAGPGLRFGSRPLGMLILEKVPLLVLSLASSVVTIVFQHADDAMASLDAIPLHWRIGNAFISYARYVLLTIRPSGLAVLYPHSGAPQAPAVIAAGIAVLLVSALAAANAKRLPWLAVGWFWYLGALVPVIGLVQVGYQAMADRYMYLPSIGLFIIAAWGVPVLLASLRHRRAVLAAAALASVLGCAILTARQLGFWTDSIALYQRTLAVTRDNAVMEYNLADALAARGDVEVALGHYTAAVRIEPDFADAWVNLGNALRRQGRIEDAIQAYRQALTIDAGRALAHNNLGLALTQQGQTEAAIAEFSEAIRLDPRDARARRNLGRALMTRGSLEEASASLDEALRIDPALDTARALRAEALRRMGRSDQAILEYTRIVRSNPDAIEARTSLAVLLVDAGRLDEAAVQYSELARRSPRSAGPLSALAGVLARMGKTQDAAARLEEARLRDPKDPTIRVRLGFLLYLLNRRAEACSQYRDALRLAPGLADIPLMLDAPPSLTDQQITNTLEGLRRTCSPEQDRP